MRFSRILSVSLLSFSVCLGLSCSYKLPPGTTPPPNDQNVQKSFFKSPNGASKTFLCGWAPISEVGVVAESTMTHKAATMPACNVQFVIEKDYLIGKQVNPSVPPQDWATVITIPISSHFNYVLDKDKYGRETRDYKYDTSQDAWNARSNMILNFNGMQTHDFAYELLYGGGTIQSVTDVEQTTYNGKAYLGFTVSLNSPIWGRYNQAQFRVNFLEFEQESPKSFPPRLYHDDNSNHFGAIWGMGKSIEGVNPVKFVARWDFRTERLPYEICLNGFEGQDHAKKLAVDAVETWNDALVKAEAVPAGKKAFVVSARTSPFGFDLRCPSITYVADQRISERSPLGIAQAQADVNTGKILWGAMTVYGGAIESYVEHYRGTKSMSSPPKETAFFSQRLGQNVVGGNPFAFVNLGKPNFVDWSAAQTMKDRPQDVKKFLDFARKDTLKKFVDSLKQDGVNTGSIQQALSAGQYETLAQNYKRDRSETERSELASGLGVKPEEFKKISGDLARMIDTLANKGNGEDGSDLEVAMAQSYAQAIQKLQNRGSGSAANFTADNFQRMMLGSAMDKNDALASEALFGDNWKNLTPDQKVAQLLARKNSKLAMHTQGTVFDMDNSIADFGAALDSLPPQIADKSNADIVDLTIRETIIHEFGHVLGLAHNFKDNVMPKEGTVPTKYFQELASSRDKVYGQNVSTTMGYPHPYQMLVKSLNEVQVGKQDELVLRYIYRNEYPVWNGKDDDFSFRQVPGDGRIPAKKTNLSGGYKVSYFPSCTDYTEILGLDPYCNRWDRGWDAKSIVKGYLDDYENNWVKKFSNIVDSGANPYYASYYLWVRSINTFAKLRKFYDYMRYNYRKEIQLIANQNKDNLYSFSKCNGDQQTNAYIKEVFNKADPEFADLCEANRMIVEKLASFLKDPGPDFTVFDNNNTAMPVGGMANDSYESDAKINGTWKELGVLPMKYSSLFTLTTAVPFWSYGPYIIPVEKYAREGDNTKYTYASLYPYEFTQAVSEGVKSNLKFNAIDGVSTQMGRTALFMGSFLSDTFRNFSSTNDYHVFDKNYMTSVRSQSDFIFNPSEALVPILVQPIRSKEANEDPDRVKTFNASVFVWGERPIQLGEAFVMPQGKIFLRNSPQTFIYPISDMYFLNDDMALVWGIRVQFGVDRYSNLGVYGVKQQLYTQYQRVIDSCIEGSKLKDYFKKGNKDFKGFKIIPGISGNENRYQTFTDSVQTEFEKYWAHPDYGAGDPQKRDVCSKAIDDVGLIVTQALAMMSYWTPQITEYVVK